VEADVPVFKEEELRCTRTGQVLSDLKGKSVFDLDIEREKELAAKRPVLGKEALKAAVAKKIGLRIPASFEPTEGILLDRVPVKRDGYVLGKAAFPSEPGIRLAV